ARRRRPSTRPTDRIQTLRDSAAPCGPGRSVLAGRGGAMPRDGPVVECLLRIAGGDRRYNARSVGRPGVAAPFRHGDTDRPPAVVRGTRPIDRHPALTG